MWLAWGILAVVLAILGGSIEAVLIASGVANGFLARDSIIDAIKKGKDIG